MGSTEVTLLYELLSDQSPELLFKMFGQDDIWLDIRIQHNSEHTGKISGNLSTSTNSEYHTLLPLFKSVHRYQANGVNTWCSYVFWESLRNITFGFLYVVS